MKMPRLRIRRVRRTDFTAVMAMLAAAGVAVPPPERATLRRFRNIVADLGADFSLVLVDGTLAGLVHVTYARQLAQPPRATLEQLVVATPFRRRGVGSALLAFAAARAGKRGCTLLCYAAARTDGEARSFLESGGLQCRGEWYVQTLRGAGGDARGDG
jgi:GNAT superfamily N-acetyltransferase